MVFGSPGWSTKVNRLGIAQVGLPSGARPFLACERGIVFSPVAERPEPPQAVVGGPDIADPEHQILERPRLGRAWLERYAVQALPPDMDHAPLSRDVGVDIFGRPDYIVSSVSGDADDIISH